MRRHRSPLRYFARATLFSSLVACNAIIGTVDIDYPDDEELGDAEVSSSSNKDGGSDSGKRDAGRDGSSGKNADASADGGEVIFDGCADCDAFSPADASVQ